MVSVEHSNRCGHPLKDQLQIVAGSNGHLGHHPSESGLAVALSVEGYKGT